MITGFGDCTHGHAIQDGHIAQVGFNHNANMRMDDQGETRKMNEKNSEIFAGMLLADDKSAGDKRDFDEFGFRLDYRLGRLDGIAIRQDMDEAGQGGDMQDEDVPENHRLDDSEDKSKVKRVRKPHSPKVIDPMMVAITDDDIDRANQLGTWLKAHRLSMKMTQEEVAEATGVVSPQYYSAIERGGKHTNGHIYKPNRAKIIRVAEALGANPNEALEIIGYAPILRTAYTPMAPGEADIISKLTERPGEAATKEDIAHILRVINTLSVRVNAVAAMVEQIGNQDR